MRNSIKLKKGETKMKQTQNKNDTIQFTMRMHPKLYAKVKENAENNKRSIRMEIEYEVEQYHKE